MPRVPTVGLSPTSRPQFQAPGVVAYGGRPIEMQESMQRGARMERIGRVVSQIGLEIEDKVNNARAQEATNVFENGVNKAFLEFQQKKGQDGVNGLAEFQQQVQELRDSAGSMLMNDMQRAAATPIFDKVGSRAELRGQSHYMEQAAAYEQTQNIMAQAVLQDSMIANPGAESLVDFGRWGNLVMKEGEARGLEGKTLQAWAMGKRDKLFEAIVTASLDSEDPSKIAAVEGLLSQLPKGFLSQTQSQALGQLVQKKSRDSQAIQWAASSLQDDVTYADGLERIAQTAKDDPQMAEAMLEKWNNFSSARDKAESEERGNLMRSLSEKISRGESLTADDITQASKAGIYDELQLVEARLDITDDYGERIVNELNRSPRAIIARYGDDEGTIGRMTDQLKAHVSQETLRVLAGQYNAYKSQETSGGTSTQGGGRNTSLPFKAGDSTTTDTVLFDKDAESAGTDGQTLMDKLEKKYGEGRSSTRTHSLNLMKERFHVEVMKQANAKWLTLTEQERKGLDRSAFVQETAREVYESGWLDQEHTRNLYTTEFRYGEPGEDLGPLTRPMRRDELEPYQDQALKELMEEERGRATQRVFDQFVPDQFVLSRQELELRASKEILGIPGITPAILAERDATRERAASKISPADIDARAEALRQQAEEATKRTTAERVTVVTNDVSRKLLSKKYQDIDLSNGQRVEGKRWFSSEPYTYVVENKEGRRALWLQSLNGLQDEWMGSGTDGTWIDAEGNKSTWEDLALVFYPGDDRDLPGDIRRKITYIKRKVASQFPPGTKFTKQQALRKFFSSTGQN